MIRAVLSWRHPLRIHAHHRHRAIGRRLVAGSRIDFFLDDSRRRREIERRARRRRRFHESSPRRQRSLRAGEPEHFFLIETGPHHGQQIRREAREPRVLGIVGGAGLACRRTREAHRARARAGAVIDHVLEHELHHVCELGRDHLLGREFVTLDHLVVFIDHRSDCIRLNFHAVVGDHRVGARDLHRRDFDSAEHDRRVQRANRQSRASTPSRGFDRVRCCSRAAPSRN